MTKEQKALLELMKIASSGNCVFSEDVKEANWQETFKLAQRQGVVGIAWNAIETLYQNQINCCPLDTKLKWYASARQQAFAMAQKKLQITEFAKKIGLPCVVLKGIDYCRFWPDENWRGFGDLDIWPLGKYEDINQRSKESGCRVEADGYYKHSEIFYKGLMIENHLFLTMFDGTKKGKVLERALQEMISADEKCGVAPNLFFPTPNFTALFMLVHAHQHFFYEGFSLRQILDWHFFLTKEEEKVDWKIVIPVLEKAGIRGLYDVMTDFCVRYFGLRTSVSYKQNDAVATKFLQEFFAEEIDDSKFSHLLRRFKRMYRFRQFLGENLLIRIKNTYLFNYLHKKPEL